MDKKEINKFRKLTIEALREEKEIQEKELASKKRADEIEWKKSEKQFRDF